jgi:hypothetical protein
MRTDKLFTGCLRDGPSRLVAFTLQTYLIGPLFETGQGKLAILATVFRALPQSLHANTGLKLFYLD